MQDTACPYNEFVSASSRACYVDFASPRALLFLCLCSCEHLRPKEAIVPVQNVIPRLESIFTISPADLILQVVWYSNHVFMSLMHPFTNCLGLMR